MVIFTLEVKAGSSASLLAYKMAVRKFAEESLLVWIDVLNALDGLWHQNSMVVAAV